ncbi:MAG: ABC-F family ATP-binding cassette domain-containing protein [Caldilineaceae bacterium]|nr:ABC-F family ATP-binding cassette domain-containing protein [Caldilineaceae bacterium]
MSLIRLSGVTKKYGDVQILRDVYFRLQAGERVGLIGQNGAGKTTVLKLILGQDEPTEGSIDVDREIRIGYFSQFSELCESESIQEILAQLFVEIHQTEQELRVIEQALQQEHDAERMEQLLTRYAELNEQIEQHEGWTIQNRIDTALTKLGFSEADRTKQTIQLSGGWRNRAALAQILLQEPDVLLLDEPTNFLDVAGLTWLEQWLLQWRGSALIVSHDRHFLDAVVTRIVEIENYHFHEYDGDFTEYIRKKQVRSKALTRQFQYEETLLAYEAEAIEDRSEARKHPNRALQRRLADIEKRVEPRLVDRIIIAYYANLHIRNELCRVEGLAKSYGERTLFQDLSFELQRGDRLAIIGPNGAGKSSLLKLLRQEEEPDSGAITWLQGGGDADSAYVDYNEMLDALDLDDTVSHAVNVMKLVFYESRKKVDQFLGLFRLSELDIKQRIGTLSGGQRARVALAQCLLSGTPVILLDEPTNHLDLQSIQVMERALLHYPGAIVVISHDRFFIDKVATRLLVLDGDGNAELIEGNWSIWQAKLAMEEKE